MDGLGDIDPRLPGKRYKTPCEPEKRDAHASQNDAESSREKWLRKAWPLSVESKCSSAENKEDASQRRRDPDEEVSGLRGRLFRLRKASREEKILQIGWWLFPFTPKLPDVSSVREWTVDTNEKQKGNSDSQWRRIAGLDDAVNDASDDGYPEPEVRSRCNAQAPIHVA